MSQEEWDLVTNQITDDANLLSTFTTHSQIYGWAKDHGFATQKLFPIVKVELLDKLGIDYVKMREASWRNIYEKQVEALENLTAEAADAPRVELWAAANEDGHFAIASADDIVWYGPFHEDDFDFEGTEESAYHSVGKKVVWLATKIRLSQALPNIRLTLHMDASPGDIARDLLRGSVDLNLMLDGSGTAADFLDMPGFKSWRDNALKNLITTVTVTE